MSRIRGKDTKPELFVRSLLHRLGFRFTVNGPRNKRLPGKPDIVLPKYGTVILVHGCFWHGHRGCRHFRLPKTRTEWWTAKIEGNRERDARNFERLREEGWHVVQLWACEFDTAAKREALAEDLAERIVGRPAPDRLAAEPPGKYGR